MRFAPTRVLALFLLMALSLLGSCSDDTTLPTSPAGAGSLEQADDFTDKSHFHTFTLVAPGVDAVYVAGSINGWNDSDPAWQLAQTADPNVWQLEREVPDGLFYYKFVLYKGTETLWVTDPAAHEVWPDGFHGNPSQWNTLYGRSFNEPQDLPYPIDRSKLVIYEINPNDFSQAGTFTGIYAGLTSGPDLADLGVNAIEIMPVTAPSYNGWGYDPVLQFSPNGAYGTATTFAALVNQAHGLGMAVILDAVVNHMAGGSVLRQIDEFTGINTFTTTEENPWGLVELNWNSPYLKDHILEALSHWVSTYKVDGFRFDYIGGEPYGTWIWLRDELRARHPDLLLIGEDFSYPANSVTYGYDAQWGGNHTDPWGGGGNNFCQVMATALNQNGFAFRGDGFFSAGAWGIPYNNMWAVANVISPNSNYAGGAPGDGFSDVKFLESHDENRVVYSVDQLGSTAAQAQGGLHRAHLGAVISLTSVGIPMIYNGQEIGSDEERPHGTSTYKIPWNDGDPGLRQAYRTLINMRLNNDALATEHINFQWRAGNVDNSEHTLTYSRGTMSDAATHEVVVTANFGNESRTWPVHFPGNGYWVKYDPLAGSAETLEMPSSQEMVTVPAGQAFVWLKNDGTSGVPLD
jgi:1,4-alpha-glucan branching enzyme